MKTNDKNKKKIERKDDEKKNRPDKIQIGNEKKNTPNQVPIKKKKHQKI